MNYSNQEIKETVSAKSKQKKTIKRVVPPVVFNVRNVGEYAVYAAADNTQDFIFSLTIDTIKHGIAEGKQTADIFSLRGKDEHNNIISLPRKEWKKALQKAINFYSRHKAYEKCIDCQQLISAI